MPTGRVMEDNLICEMDMQQLALMHTCIHSVSKWIARHRPYVRNERLLLQVGMSAGGALLHRDMSREELI